MYVYSGVACFITDYVTGEYTFALSMDSIINQPPLQSPPYMLTTLTVNSI
jgi:hypothetical protein